jgi:hypothetical protein
MTTVHPLLLDGPNMESWKTFIPDMLNELLNPFDTIVIIREIIRIGPGKYIVTFNNCNTVICNLVRELYYDTARFVFSSEYVFDVSIADITMHRYTHVIPFKTSAPYKNVINPFILYKGRRPQQFTCEISEDTSPKRHE